MRQPRSDLGTRKRRLQPLAPAIVILLALPLGSRAAAPDTLFAAVRIFDGVSSSLSEPTNVLVRGNTIAAIGGDTVSPDAVDVDSRGHTLVPGLIDVHVHMSFSALTMERLLDPDLTKSDVETAEDRNTYVTVHAYHPRSVRRAIEAGVKCIEHGQLLDEETLALMADRGIWLSLQNLMADSPNMLEARRIKRKPVIEGQDSVWPI